MVTDINRIRAAAPDDAAQVIAFFQKLYGETAFMLYEVGESVPSEQQQRQFISDGLENHTSAMQLCFAGAELVGVCLGFRGFSRRQQHSLHLVLGVARAQWGRGIGTRLMQAVEAWAIEQKLRRLDLSVHANNPRALHLYERVGFVHEGSRRGSLIVNDVEVDEYLMAKRLPASTATAAPEKAQAARVLLNIDVPDIEAAIAFYGRALDLTLARMVSEDVAELSGATAVIYLLRNAERTSASSHAPEMRRSYARHWTPVHLDFIVDNLASSTKRALQGGAVQESECVCWNGSKCITFADPFGHGFCLIEFERDTYHENDA